MQSLAGSDLGVVGVKLLQLGVELGLGLKFEFLFLQLLLAHHHVLVVHFLVLEFDSLYHLMKLVKLLQVPDEE